MLCVFHNLNLTVSHIAHSCVQVYFLEFYKAYLYNFSSPKKQKILLDNVPNLTINYYAIHIRRV